IYLHRLDNALQASTNRTSHVSLIMRLLAGWNGTETFGIPVGNDPSRILAEITISDVDEALLARRIP
ncbi:MAG: reverse transcriptase, partial [Candidatus Thermoplasmatota archaeon]|nr:reverse transcriptase [Candidatus Thermoplasmatota archaeon]